MSHEPHGLYSLHADDLSPRLGKPAISLYRHHLTSDLETAIRGSNAQYDSPDVLRRLDARILEYSHGEIGWDCFALEYKVEAPLNAVLDTKAMIGYDKVFRHLWRLKRVESTLTKGWMRVTCQSKLFEKISSEFTAQSEGTESDLVLDVKADWHHCRIVQAEMVHFIRQIQAYCQLEVIECSWESMMQYMSKREGDMDALIQAHRAYIDRIVRKILLLGSSKSDKEVSRRFSFQGRSMILIRILLGHTSQPRQSRLDIDTPVQGCDSEYPDESSSRWY